MDHLNALRWLDPKLILAEAWSPYRLERCREQLAAGLEAPAINVVSSRIALQQVFYGVSDGMHRTVAHREAGVRVKARIGGYNLIEPVWYTLRQAQVWRREGQGSRAVTDVPEGLRPVLLTLGVEGD